MSAIGTYCAGAGLPYTSPLGAKSRVADMDLVFSTDAIEPTKRYAAWQGAICDVYVHVDVKSEQRSDYRGFIREARFGAVTMTDVLLSEQHRPGDYPRQSATLRLR